MQTFCCQQGCASRVLRILCDLRQFWPWQCKAKVAVRSVLYAEQGVNFTWLRPLEQGVNFTWLRPLKLKSNPENCKK